MTQSYIRSASVSSGLCTISLFLLSCCLRGLTILNRFIPWDHTISPLYIGLHDDYWLSPSFLSMGGRRQNWKAKCDLGARYNGRPRLSLNPCQCTGNERWLVLGLKSPKASVNNLFCGLFPSISSFLSTKVAVRKRNRGSVQIAPLFYLFLYILISIYQYRVIWNVHLRRCSKMPTPA